MSRVRLEIISRSSWAKLSRPLGINLPIDVLVLHCRVIRKTAGKTTYSKSRALVLPKVNLSGGGSEEQAEARLMAKIKEG